MNFFMSKVLPMKNLSSMVNMVYKIEDNPKTLVKLKEFEKQSIDQLLNYFALDTNSQIKKIKKENIRNNLVDVEFGNIDEHFTKMSQEHKEVMANPVDYLNNFTQKVIQLSALPDKD